MDVKYWSKFLNHQKFFCWCCTETSAMELNLVLSGHGWWAVTVCSEACAGMVIQASRDAHDPSDIQCHLDEIISPPSLTSSPS